MDDNERRRMKEAEVRKAVKGRVALKLVSWNVNSFAQREVDLETLFEHEEPDVLFVYETLQSRFSIGIICPLKFEGSAISMPAIKNRKRGRPSMGIAFLAKQKGLIHRESARQGRSWQMLEISTADTRIVGLYATPSATSQEWRDINASLKLLRGKGGRNIVCGDFNASHPSWNPSGKTRGGNALQALIKPLQRREPRAAAVEVGKRLPSNRGRQQRKALFTLRASRGVTHPFGAKDGSMAGSTIDLLLVSEWKSKLPPIPTILMSLAACASDHLPIAMTIKLRNRQRERAKEIFLPTPHQRNAIAVEAADEIYKFQLPRIASKLRACGSKIAFDAHVEELQAVLRKPWITKVKPKPQRHTAEWSATADRIAKWRFKVVRRALSSKEKLVTGWRRGAWIMRSSAS